MIKGLISESRGSWDQFWSLRVELRRLPGCKEVRNEKLHVFSVLEGRRSWPKLRHFKHLDHIEDVIRFRFRDRIWASLDRGFPAICVDNMSRTSGSITEKLLWILRQITKSQLNNKLTSWHYFSPNSTAIDAAWPVEFRTGLNCLETQIKVVVST